MTPFKKKVLLASPYMHGEELEYVKDAFAKNWITTAGENINELEKTVAEKLCPNFWLNCLLIDKEAMGEHVRSGRKALYKHIDGRTTPTEIFETLAAYNAEGRPIWKPMHMQPYYINNPFITQGGNGRARTNAYIDGTATDASADIFDRGLCLPSDLNMTEEEQEGVIEVVRGCFRAGTLM